MFSDRSFHFISEAILCMISCVCHKVDEICGILANYAVSSVNSVIGFPETSVKMQLYAA